MQAEVVRRGRGRRPGAAATCCAAVDGLDVVHCMSWPYDDPAGRLRRRAIGPARHGDYAGMGGTVGQQLLERGRRTDRWPASPTSRWSWGPRRSTPSGG